MIVRLDTHRLQTLDQVREFLDGSEQVDLQPQTRADAYAFVAKTVRRFDYALRGKADKGLLRRFLAKVAGLSRAQITRLLQQHRTTGEIADRRGAPRRPFPRRYTNADIGLLAELDVLHGTLFRSGHAQALRPRFPSVRRPPLRTPGRHLQRPSVQPAAHDKLSTAPRNDAAADAPGAVSRSGNAAARSRSDNLAGCAGRYRPSRRPGRHQGPLPREPGG